MRFASLRASDRLVLIAGAVIAITALISFIDPAGYGGGIMLISLLAGLGAAYVTLQPQVAPERTLPATRGLSLLVLGTAATAASAIAGVASLGYIIDNLTDSYVLIFLVGLVASVALLWVGWTAYNAEGEGPETPRPA